MASLIDTAIASLDGYVADLEGSFAWAEPDDEVFAFVNRLEREVGTYLYGRRMYEVMAGWETISTGPGQPARTRDYATIWRAADKLVFSRTLDAPASARTRLVRSFITEYILRMKEASARDLSVGGTTLAATALRDGLVDEVGLFLMPTLAGGGTSALPAGLRLGLHLLEERRFAGGTVYLRYRAEG